MSKPVTGAIQTMCDTVKSTVLDLINKTGVDMYTGIVYIQEKNDPAITYYVKIQISTADTGYIHVKISVPSENAEPEAQDVLPQQTRSSPLKPF